MNGISHKQAIQLIHRRLDGLLNESQLLLLDEHLGACDSCRAYAIDMDGLSADVQNEFHRHWDTQLGPSQKVFEHVTTKASNIPMTNRISSGVKLLAGAMALLAVAVGINFVVSRLQSTSPVTNATEIVDSISLPANRLLAFASDQNGNFDIYTVRADGSGLTNLTNHPSKDSNPIWSPDGNHIAFESDRGGFKQIYIMDSDGSNVTKFTNDKADHSLPLNMDGKSNPWSPDGSKFLFLQSSAGREIWNLYVRGIDGENHVLLGTGRFSHNDISWSSNGKYIAYVLNESPTPNETFVTGIYVVDSNGNNAQELKKLIPQNENLGSYYWSSDGQSIVFIADKNDGPGQTVYEFDLETNTLLQKDMLKQGVIDWQDEISLISERSAFVWQRADGTSNTLDWGDPNCLLDVTRSLHGNFAIGAYCPDSKKFKLYWANADGSTIKQLLDSATLIGQLWDIAWSPDDQYIAFNISLPNKTDMYVLNVSESLSNPSIQPVQVSVSGGELYSIPAWQPIHVPDLADNSPEMKIDPQSCKPASELNSALQPPNELYGYDVVQGTSFVDGDFSYEFWLYCDSSLKPDDNEHFSSVTGLGVYASWRYTGPEVEGTSQYHFAFEPNVPLGTTSWDGPFYKASGAGVFGVGLSEQAIQEHIQQGVPIQFHVVVDSSLGQNGATFSFYLEPTENGLRIVDLQVTQTEDSHDGLIAFTSEQSGNLDIYTMRADGSEITNITNAPANDSSPLCSPDGKRIAFISERTGNADIFSMDPDGSNLRQLTDNPGYDGYFSWSPDGQKIIYLTSSGNDPNTNSYQLIVMNADGSNKTALTEEPGSYIFLGWSLSGQKIVYQKQNSENIQNNEIHVIDINRTNHYQWRAIIDEIKWTDEGHFIGHGWSGISEPPSWKIYKFDANGSDPIEIAIYPSRIVALFNQTYLVEGIRTLAWYSPDATTSPLKSWDFGTHCTKQGDLFLQETGHTISPDKTRAFVNVHCFDDVTWFYLENTDGSQFVQLTDFSVIGPVIESANWSPDSKYVTMTIASRDGGTADIYLFDIQKMLNDPSTQPVQLTTDGAMKYGAVWQPNP
jgi:Tol biopolymer transport system component